MIWPASDDAMQCAMVSGEHGVRESSRNSSPDEVIWPIDEVEAHEE